ncbi:hypothetical protein BT69DRAFT_1287868, partial [Atractiella rhizophila]
METSTASKGNCVKTSSRSFCSYEKHNDRSGPLNPTISATPFRRVVSISITYWL